MNKYMATVVVYNREFLLSTATPESLQQPTLRSREEESQTIASSVVRTALEREDPKEEVCLKGKKGILTHFYIGISTYYFASTTTT